MHFSVPDYTEFVHTTSRQSFQGFNIHINGIFHACLRYKQLNSLHQQLTKTFPNIQLPPFPGKRLFLLTPGQLEERRASLERYLQLLGQDPIFSRSELLRTFLLTSQHESAGVEEGAEVTLDVHLLNDQQVSVTAKCPFNSHAILELVCRSLGLPPELMYFFSLFVVRKRAGERGVGVDVDRALMNYESPYITLRHMGDGFKCVVRKSYWDKCYDEPLLGDPVALNLLYVQAVSDNEGWTTAMEQSASRKLAQLQARGDALEYVEYSRSMPSYGVLRYRSCIVDYPQPNTSATVLIGNKDIQFVLDNAPQEATETSFRVTRIRCWKITTTHQPDETPTTELNFEYLMSKNYLKWIQIRSPQCSAMAVCLQSIVTELLNQKGDSNMVKAASVTKPNVTINYPRRDELNEFRPSNQRAPTAHPSTTLPTKVREISTTVFFKNGINRVHNDAFEGIGDNDL